MSRLTPTTQGTGGAKLLGGILLGGGVVAALTFLKDSATALMIFGGGLVLVAIAWVVYALIVARKDRAQSSIMSRSIAASAGATPGAISSPAKRARLDDLRKSFEKGLDKFRAADKDVYSVPWYLVVGEPGSGKTEAIRHCKIGFPPGLQDPLQGAGGTVNMHWWFTNHGVFLDTAGRLMFEEVEPGNTNEWQEFMRLLVKARPNCPINGMFLFIPADALIKDSAEALETKGAKIAAQLDQIQRELGVRFPVYVIVSKCDLVNGFREFFDDINDPKLQDQIVGWSSPASLDTPFRAEQVDEYIRQVQDRLARRRSGVLMDPVHTEDPKLRRADQVDALYAFPDSLGKLSTRLRRYLEMVFVAGAWSAKPLFLRGIYFTSSMREGSALDQELAEALGVSIDKLPEGRVWEKDRSFFLRDVFLDKAFPEQGLVSRAANVTKQLRGWKHAVLGLMGGGAAAVAALTWLGYRSLDSAIVAPAKFWNDARDAFITKGEKPVRNEVYYLPVVEKSADAADYAYLGGQEHAPASLRSIADVPAESATLGKFPLALKTQATRQVEVPLIFRPIGMLLGDRAGNLLATERLTAARTLFEGSWVRPAYGAARERLARDAGAGTWSTSATEALAAIARVEAGSLASGAPDLTGTMKYALGPNWSGASSDVNDAQQFSAWLYNRQGGQQPWPSAPMLAAGSSSATIDKAIDTFVKVWKGDAKVSPDAGVGNLPELRLLLADLRAFDKSEGELLALGREAKDPAQLAERWTKSLAELKEREVEIGKRLSLLGGKPLGEAYSEHLRTFREAGAKQHDALREAFNVAEPAADAKATSDVGTRHARMSAWAKRIDDSKNALATEPEVFASERRLASTLDQRLLGGPDAPILRARLAMYSVVQQRLTLARPSAEPGVGEVDTRLDDVESRQVADLEAIRSGAAKAGSAEPSPDAQGVCAALIELASKGERSGVLESFYASARVGAVVEGIQAAVKSLASSAREDLARPELPLIGWTGGSAFDARFAPKAAQQVLADFVRAQRTLELEHGKSIVLGREAIVKKSEPAARSVSEYVKAMSAYWAGLNEQFTPAEAPLAQVRTALAAGAGKIKPALESLVARQELAAKVARNVTDGWTELGESTDAARLAAAASAARASLSASGAAIEAAASAWAALPENGAQAQRQVAQTGAGLAAKFVAGAGTAKDDLVKSYASRAFCVAMSACAAEPTDSPAMAAAEEARTLGSRFPLFGPSEGGILTSEQFEALRAAIDRFSREASESGEPSPTGDSCIDTAMGTIVRAHRPTSEARAFVQRVQDALSAVRPGVGEGLMVSVRAAEGTGQDPASPASQAGVWQLFSDGQPLGERVDVTRDRVPLGKIVLPSTGSVELRLIGKGGRIVARGTLGQSWDLLRKIEQSGVRRDAPGERRVFGIAVPITLDGREWTANLDLEFNRSLPDTNWLPR